MAKVHLENISKSFGKVNVLDDINLEINSNEFTVFVGPSGCGKSTLLRIIAGLEDVTKGKITIRGVDVTHLAPAKRKIAMVFQSYALYPHMTVFENMAFSLKMTKYPRKEIKNRVINAAKELHVDHLLERKPKQLSGGQRQRVAIGRALVRDPLVYLFDEPLSNLDAALRVKMRMRIAQLKEQLSTTMIYVTHDQVEAMTLADKIVVLQNGRIEQVGKPLELYHTPHNQFVAGFLGSPKMNFIHAEIHEITNKEVIISLPKGKELSISLHNFPDKNQLSVGQKVNIGIRPENITRSDRKEDALFEGKVTLIENLGSEIYAHTQVGKDQDLLVRKHGSAQIDIGENLYLNAKTEDFHLFDAQTQHSLYHSF